MEADWAVEVGGELPWIDVEWQGFVDLRSDGAAVAQIAEAAEEPALREALAVLNGAGSPVFTSKCDVWALGDEEIDATEFDCGEEATLAGVACYVDVVTPMALESLEEHMAWARRIVERLRTVASPAGRVDVVVRSAVLHGASGFGLTIYAAGCGADAAAAHESWEKVLEAAVAVTMAAAETIRASSSIG